LKLGDNWDAALAKAQRNSNITVVLVSSHTQSAYYQREEVAAAIAMAREDGHRHRVVPLFLDDANNDTNAIPYGLRLKHGVRISRPNDMKSAALRLLDLRDDIENIPARILDARITAIEGSSDIGQPASLETLTESTSKAGAAIHAFTSAIENMVRSGVRTVDFLADRRERSRLRTLLRGLMSIEYGQAPLPWLLRGYKHTIDSGFDNWGQITSSIARLTPQVAEVTELLATIDGDFVVSARNAYKSLLFGLRARDQVYEEISSIDRPSSPEDFARLETMAAQYETMIGELKQVQEAIGRYLDN
jgi:hypothetical protein